MTDFVYIAILGQSGKGPPAGLAAAQGPAPDSAAVLWDHVDRTWRAFPAAEVPLLSDPRFAAQRVRLGRTEAERIARTHLAAELPTEDQLRQLLQAPSPVHAPRPPQKRNIELENEDWLRSDPYRSDDNGG